MPLAQVGTPLKAAYYSCVTKHFRTGGVTPSDQQEKSFLGDEPGEPRSHDPFGSEALTGHMAYKRG